MPLLLDVRRAIVLSQWSSALWPFSPQTDAPALLALPLQRYQMAHFKTVSVHIDYHVEVERHRYSVPHALVGQVLEASITTAVVDGSEVMSLALGDWVTAGHSVLVTGPTGAGK